MQNRGTTGESAGSGTSRQTSIENHEKWKSRRCWKKKSTLITHGLSTASDAEAQQRLKRVAVRVGTSSSAGLVELRNIVANVEETVLESMCNNGVELSVEAYVGDQHLSCAMVDLSALGRHPW